MHQASQCGAIECVAMRRQESMHSLSKKQSKSLEAMSDAADLRRWKLMTRNDYGALMRFV